MDDDSLRMHKTPWSATHASLVGDLMCPLIALVIHHPLLVPIETFEK
jgi:hypothetical protein